MRAQSRPSAVHLQIAASDNGDCDDQDPYTFNGAATNDDPGGLYCLTDVDQDGYAAETDPCYRLEMTDSYGDGWTGGSLIIDGPGSCSDSQYSDEASCENIF